MLCDTCLDIFKDTELLPNVGGNDPKDWGYDLYQLPHHLSSDSLPISAQMPCTICCYCSDASIGLLDLKTEAILKSPKAISKYFGLLTLQCIDQANGGSIVGNVAYRLQPTTGLSNRSLSFLLKGY